MEKLWEKLNMMKKMIVSVLAVALLQGSASADWANDFMCGQFWVAGEALLLRPSGIYPYVAIIEPVQEELEQVVERVATDRQVTRCLSYKWGYKIEVGYRVCNNELLVNWASFNNGYVSKFRAAADELISPVQGFIKDSFQGGKAVARDCFHYDVLDAELGHWMCKECSRLAGRVFLGVRYARVVYSQGIRFFKNDGISPLLSLETSDVQGTGPRMGLGGRYDLCWGFGLTGSVAGHLLIGSVKSRVAAQMLEYSTISDEDSMISEILVRNQPACRLIPASEVKFGVDYRMCLFCGLSAFGEVGYQLTHYFYGSQDLFAPADGMANRVLTHPISFDGWYFRLGLQY